MRVFAVLTLVLFSLPANAQPDWRFVHPDATLVGSIRPQPLLSSPLIGEALAAVQKDAPTGAQESLALGQAAMALSMARGFLGGVQEVRFSLMDNGTPEPDVIALITGTLDDATLGLLAQGQASLKRVDATTVLIGTSASVEAAARRMSQTTAALQPRALSGVEALLPYDLWISGKIPDLPMAAALNMNLRGLALGLSLRDNLEAQLAMEAGSAAQAETLIKTAHEAENSQPAQYRGLLRSSADGHTARFRLNVPRALLLDAIQTRTLAQAASPLPPPPAPRRNTIIIEGLDSGPKEIPLK